MPVRLVDTLTLRHSKRLAHDPNALFLSASTILEGGFSKP